MAAQADLQPGAGRSARSTQIVEQRIRPQLERLLQQLVREGRAMQIDGTPVFNGSDRFLPGKIALAFSDLIAPLPPDDPRLDAVRSRTFAASPS